MTDEEKMTPEEAIAEISFLKVAVNKVMEQALDMAIKALEQNESAEEWYKLFVKKLDEQEPCTDAVSIDAVIEWLKDKDIIKLFSQEETARKELKALSSVTQKSGNPQPSEHFIDGVHAMGYREGYKDAQKQKCGE